MTSAQQPERRAEAYSARRLQPSGASLVLGYARCPACGWWAARGTVQDAQAAADAHRCPEGP